MQSRMGWGWLAVLAAVGAGVGVATAEVRTWSDASGKFSVEAELLSAKDGKVVLRSTKGKEITVPISQLSEADSAFLKEQKSADKPASAAKSSTTKNIRTVAERFFKDLRTKEREVALSTLTDAAQALAKEGKSPFEGIPSPDKPTTAIKPTKVTVNGPDGEIIVLVRASGQVQKTTLYLRYESDEWRVCALGTKVGAEDKKIDFEAAPPKPEEKPAETPAPPPDPLLALVGKPLDLEGVTSDGKPLDMAQFKGKVVLINFWATWCGPCRAEIPNILANWQQHHEAGFEVIAISVDQDLGELNKFVGEEKPPWTVVADFHPENKNSMARKYGIQGIPAFILVGKDGNVAAVHCRGARLGAEVAKLLGS